MNITMTHNRKKTLPLLALLIVATVQPTVVCADPVLDRMRDQLRQTITQLRQLEDENISLKAKQAAVVAAPVVKVVAKENTAELAQLRTSARKETERAAALQKQVDELSIQLQQLQTTLSQTVTDLKAQQTTVTMAKGQLQDALGKQKVCEGFNQNFAMMTTEILALYERQDLWQTLGNREPVTALYRVKLENMVQDYQIKIADSSVASETSESNSIVKESQ